MRIGLTADFHLDKRLGSRTDELGVNMRSRDLENAVRQVVDGFIRTRVEVAVIAGDLFDNAKPAERTRQFLVGELHRLITAGIEVLLLRGNHDAPMTFTDATAIGTAALALPSAVVADNYEVVQHVRGDVAFTMVPWMRSDTEFLLAIEGLTPVAGKHNLLLLHAGMADLPEYAQMRPGSQTLTRSLVPYDRFDWIFSGHFHGRRVLEDLRWTFIGSPERISVTEVYQPEKGFLVYDTAISGAAGALFHAIPTRPWYDLKTLDGSDWDRTRLLAELQALPRDIPEWEEAIVRVHVSNLRTDVHGAIDKLALNQLRGSAFHADIEMRAADPLFDAAQDGDGDGPLFDDTDAEWTRHAGSLSGRTAEEIARVTNLGLAALHGQLGEGAVAQVLSGADAAIQANSASQ